MYSSPSVAYLAVTRQIDVLYDGLLGDDDNDALTRDVLAMRGLSPDA